MFRLKAFSIILHIAGWSLFLMFPLLIMENSQEVRRITEVYTWPYFQFCLCYILLFYINCYFLIPKFFLVKKYLYYFLCLLLLYVGVFFLRPFDHLMNSRRAFRQRFEMSDVPPPFNNNRPDFNRMPPPGYVPGDFEHRHWRGGPRQWGKFHRIDVTSLLIFILIMAFGMALRSVKQWQITEKRAILAEAEKAIAELSFLKAQINPHFLYNTLNNIYTLSVIGSEKTSESIMKLSNIMRYVTDEAEADFVTLISELNCIGNFIDLQKLRLGKTVTLDYRVTGDPRGYQISPLLLMTFIENVFKYGLSNHEQADIHIHISVGEDQILFHSQNTIFNHQQPTERSGIGIMNTRKRLDYLYPDKYVLKIDKDDHLFTVDLVLHS
ncbi:sensor histidine kinase [Pedobacter sp. L105]|uniref:sensor histidine kinase n=1 Tax=Pedobacter sp. L105 TaxID=1641871 RepID=UPI00131E2721|nr:sensor histidine kinase [Pedobacter sp. L105]